MISTSKKSILFKILFVVLILIFFITPMIFPSDLNWINGVDSPPIIFTGATGNPPSSDWKESLEWIKINTPKNSVIASWWDYGYWIQTLGERTTLSDNSTIHTSVIQNIAKLFLSSPNDSWNTLQEMNVDYIVTFISVQKIDAQWGDDDIYLLGGGGDESKIFWFAKIAELPVEKYLEPTDVSVKTNYFWNETLLGKMIPYTVVTYYNDQHKKETNSYLPGFMDLSIKEIKIDHDSDGPLKLVYASPSFYDDSITMKNCVFIYEINKNYVSSKNP